MSVNAVDTLIVGQGLAGTNLAWLLHRLGKTIAIVDRDESDTASRVAAGLITPITGQRFAMSSGWDAQWRLASEFYQAIQTEFLNESPLFFRTTPAVRLFASAEEADYFQEHRARRYRGVVSTPSRLLDESFFETTFGGFEMSVAGRLQTDEFLAASRTFFTRLPCCHFITGELRPELDILAEPDRFQIPRLDLVANRIVFCQGFGGRVNRWFPGIPSKPAKGEILTIRIPGCRETRVIHHDIWLAPIGDELFRAGSTFEWDQLDSTPTDAGRATIENRLKKFLKKPYEVVDHQAAVRPAMHDQQPQVVFSKAHPNLAAINGLGSKGALHSPACAREYVRQAYNATNEFVDDDK